MLVSDKTQNEKAQAALERENKHIGLVRQPGWLPHKSCIFGSKAPKNAVF